MNKRSPLNLRRLLRIDPRKMVKTVATALLASTRLSGLALSSPERGDHLRAYLRERAVREGDRVWWGYEFPVQTRWAYYETACPNAVVTSFAVQALLASDVRAEDESLFHGAARQLLAMCEPTNEGTVIRYVPGSVEVIHNASAMAAATLAGIGERLGERVYVERALDVGRTVMRAQKEAGGWPYGESPNLAWEDAFHTAYTLLGLHRLKSAGLDAADVLHRGTGYLIDAFATDAGELRFYAGRKPFPEAHNIGTCVQAFVDLAEYDPRSAPIAQHVCRWGIDHLWIEEKQRFAYRSFAGRKVTLDYPRWSDGHMLLGLATLARHLRDTSGVSDE
jgi:hypothetical protein